MPSKDVEGGRMPSRNLVASSSPDPAKQGGWASRCKAWCRQAVSRHPPATAARIANDASPSLRARRRWALLRKAYLEGTLLPIYAGPTRLQGLLKELRQARSDPDRQLKRVLLHKKLAAQWRKEALPSWADAQEDFGPEDEPTLFEKLIDEAALLGIRFKDWVTPNMRELGIWTPYVTVFMTSACLVTYSWMAAEYHRWLDLHCPNHELSGGLKFEHGTGPKELARWYRFDDDRTFISPYMVAYGARRAKDIAEMGPEGRRWFTSWFIHFSFDHIFNNLLIFVPIGLTLECKYGWHRFGIIVFLSGLGGCFIGALAESYCRVVGGLSGICFGVFGLFMADMVLNYETITYPVMRSIIIFAFLLQFLISGIADAKTVSAYTHLGGLLSGCIPGFVFLPNIKKERWECCLPWLAVIYIVLVFGFFPWVIYKFRWPEREEECTVYCVDPDMMMMGRGDEDFTRTSQAYEKYDSPPASVSRG